MRLALLFLILLSCPLAAQTRSPYAGTSVCVVYGMNENNSSTTWPDGSYTSKPHLCSFMAIYTTPSTLFIAQTVDANNFLATLTTWDGNPADDFNFRLDPYHNWVPSCRLFLNDQPGPRLDYRVALPLLKAANAENK